MRFTKNLKNKILLTLTITISPICLNIAHSSEMPILEQAKMSYKDRVFIKDFIHILKDVSDLKVNKREIQKVIKNNKNNLFSDEIQYLKAILRVEQKRNIDYIIASCASTMQMSNEYLQNNFDNYCFEKIDFYINDFTYFNEARIVQITDYLNTYHQIIFEDKKSKFLKTYEKLMLKNANLKNRIFPIISNLIIKHNYQIDLDFIGKFEINSSLTRHIQKQILFAKDQNLEKHFYKKYLKLLNYLDTEKDQDLLTKNINEFLKYFNKSKLLLNDQKAMERISVIAQALLRRQHYQLAMSILTVLRKNNYKDVHDAHFCQLYALNTLGQTKEALKYIEKENIIKNLPIFKDSRLEFWVAKTFENDNQTNKALEIFNNIILKDPFNFYAIMSNKQIRNIKSDNDQIQNNTNTDLTKRIKEAPEFSFKSINASDIKYIRKINYYSYFNHYGLFRYYISKMLENSKNQVEYSERAYIVSNILRSNNNFIESFKIIYKGIDSGKVVLNQSILAFLFPRPDYLEFIKTNGKNKNIDPFLILSLIRQESGFNPRARSRVGALGLMQIMPATAKTISKRITKRDLKKPHTNINLGTKYLKYLLEKYNNNVVYALSAYNAGESRVEEWIEKFFNSDSLIDNVEMIPFPETRKYVKLISRNLFFYKYLEDAHSDSKDFNKIYDVELGFTK